MNITVTHTIAPEVIALLEKFLPSPSANAAQPAAPKEPGKVKSLPKKTESTTDEEPSGSLAVNGEKVEALKAQAGTTTEAATSTEPVTQEMLRAAVNAKAKDGHREGIKALLSEFGTPKVSELDESKRSNFLTRLNAL